MPTFNLRGQLYCILSANKPDCTCELLETFGSFRRQPLRPAWNPISFLKPLDNPEEKTVDIEKPTKCTDIIRMTEKGIWMMSSFPCHFEYAF
jgi:hypothetical protein